MVRVLRDDGDEVAVDESFRPGCGYIDVSFHRCCRLHRSNRDIFISLKFQVI